MNLTFDPSRFETITDLKRLKTWVNVCSKARSSTWDTETTGLDTMTAEIVGVAMAVESGSEIRAAYLPLAHRKGAQLAKGEALAVIRPLLEDATKPKIFHNAAYDFNVFRHERIQLANIHDSMMMSYVLHGHTHYHGMDPLAETYLKWKTIKFDDVVIPRLGMKDFRDVKIDVATQYAAEDVAVTHAIAKILQALLKAQNLWHVYSNIDRHMPEVLADMKWNGVRVNFDALAQLKTEWTASLEMLRQRAYEQAGREFDLNSATELAKLFFTELGLEPLKYGKSGKPSLDKETLKEFEKTNPVAETLLSYRKLAKYVSTYCDGLAKFENPVTHRIHGNLLAHRTSTGRLAANEPNTQNQPSRTDDSEFGKEGIKVRRAFVAPKGKKLIASDYSQIEYRILGHVTQARKILDAYHNNEDLHARMAADVLGVAIADVPGPERSTFKNVNFATIYGAGPKKIAQMSKIELARAYVILDAHREMAPEVYDWKEETLSFAFDHGYSETLFGRRIYVPDITSGDREKRGEAERLAINGAIQGSAADLMRLAMVRVEQWCKEDRRVKMLLSVHDELVLEADEDDAEYVRRTVKTLMEEAADHLIAWRVPIIAEAKIGNTWYEAK